MDRETYRCVLAAAQAITLAELGELRRGDAPRVVGARIRERFHRMGLRAAILLAASPLPLGLGVIVPMHPLFELGRLRVGVAALASPLFLAFAVVLLVRALRGRSAALAGVVRPLVGRARGYELRTGRSTSYVLELDGVVFSSIEHPIVTRVAKEVRAEFPLVAYTVGGLLVAVEPGA